MKNRLMKTLFLLLPAFLFSFSLRAQITMEQTLAYINGKLGAKCTIEVVHGIVIARYYENGTLFREDKVSLKELDLKRMGYEAKDKIFFIPCRGDDDCVDRKLFDTKIRRQYSRFSFVLDTNKKSVDGMMKAFSHMSKLAASPKYSSSEPFE